MADILRNGGRRNSRTAAGAAQGLEEAAHDRAALRRPPDLDEARLLERAHRAVVGERVRPARLRVARVALERLALALPDELRGGLEERDRHALPAVRLRDEE